MQWLTRTAEENLNDFSFAAEGLAEQEAYNAHLSKSGHVPEHLPAGVTHMHDAVEVQVPEVEENYFPSEEERRTLRRVPEKLSMAAFAIGVCELAERFSYYGVTQVFTNYISNPIPLVDGHYSNTGAAKNEHKSGALGRGSQVANGLVTFNQFWCYVTPLLGAWVADAHLGRFNTLCVGVAIAMIGHIILIVSGVPALLPNDPSESSDRAIACFAVAIVIMGIGTGFFKSNCSTLIAEQSKIKEQTVIKLKSGEKVIVDPALTIARIYLWFYLMINIGSFCGELSMVYAEKYVGYWLSYMLPTLVFIIPIPVLWFGRNYYVKLPPDGSVLERALKAWGLAIRTNWTWNLSTFVKRCKSSTFWDPAKPSHLAESERKPWMVYEDHWIDELSRGIKACAVFVLFPFYWLCYNQIINNLIIQANQMDLGSAPSEIVSLLDPIFIIVFVFVFNMGLYPLLDYLRIPFTPIKRIAIDFFFASFAMVWSAVLQHYIYKQNPCGDRVGDAGVTINGLDCGTQYASMTVWIQSGAYILMAISELFASVTSMEIAMLMAPKNMRSIVMAISLFTTAIAAAIGEAFTALSRNPLFVVNYALFAGLSFAGGILFYMVFYSLDRRQEQLNLLSQEGYMQNASSDEKSEKREDTSVQKNETQTDSLAPSLSSA